MKNIKKIAVLGGGGRTGKYVVNQLLEKEFNVKVLLRNPESFSILNSKVEIIKGDAINESAIKSLLKGCHAVVSTIGQRPGEPMVASQATMNIIKIMNEFDIQRYVLLAGINIDTPFDKKSKKTTAATDWMKTNYPEIQKDRQLTYDLLTESNIEWTLVRVPYIEFTEATYQVIVNPEDCPGDKISSSDIANFMVQEIIDAKFIRRAPFITNI